MHVQMFVNNMLCIYETSYTEMQRISLDISCAFDILNTISKAINDPNHFSLTYIFK